MRASRIRRATGWRRIWLSLEGGVAARVFASGMAAINAIATMLKSGDHVVAGRQSLRWHAAAVQPGVGEFRAEFTYVDTSDVKNVARALKKNTRMVYPGERRPIR